MPTSTSRLSYEDCFLHFDEALADPVGIRLCFAKPGDAYQLRVRLNAARVLDRQENAEVYEPGHPLFGRSEYDQLQVRLIATLGQPETWVYIERRGANIIQIDRLSEIGDYMEVEYEEQKQIEASPLKQLTWGEVERRD